MSACLSVAACCIYVAWCCRIWLRYIVTAYIVTAYWCCRISLPFTCLHAYMYTNTLPRLVHVPCTCVTCMLPGCYTVIAYIVMAYIVMAYGVTCTMSGWLPVRGRYVTCGACILHIGCVCVACILTCCVSCTCAVFMFPVGRLSVACMHVWRTYDEHMLRVRCMCICMMLHVHLHRCCM